MNDPKSMIAASLALAASLSMTGCMSLIPMMAPTVKTEKDISAEFPFESRYAEVNGAKMHYVDVGSGTPVVFIHGNPTSSYLWRNVIPIVAKNNRAIAVDLIGMGKSDKPALEYSLADHIRYFDGFMDALNLKNAVLVVHDWGGPIGIDYAMRHPDRVKGIIMMETIVRPMRWSEAPLPMRYMFKKFRDPAQGDDLLIRKNYFVEKLLPMMAGRKMTEAEMSVYRAPYLKESDRRPIANFPREIPIDGVPRENVERIERNYELLRDSNIPLLLLRGHPGAIIQDAQVDSLKKGLPRMRVEDIGPGIHYLQEAQPTRIGTVLAEWLSRLP